MQIRNIVLPTRHFDDAVRFYRDVLGWPVAFTSESYCFLRAGELFVAIHPIAADSPFFPTGHGFYLDIIVHDIAPLRTKFVQEKITILREWIENGTEFLLVSDPDGNRLEFYQENSNP